MGRGGGGGGRLSLLATGCFWLCVQPETGFYHSFFCSEEKREASTRRVTAQTGQTGQNPNIWGASGHQNRAERPSRAGGRPCPPERLKRLGSNHRKSRSYRPGTTLGWNAPRIRPEHLLEPQTLTGTGLVLKKPDTYRHRGSAWARLRCLCLQVTEARQGELGGAAPNQPENQRRQGGGFRKIQNLAAEQTELGRRKGGKGPR